MITYIVSFTISEEIMVDSNTEEGAIWTVHAALRDKEYPLNLDRLFIHAKAIDSIKRLS